MPAAAPTADHLLLRAIRGEAVPRVPVWAMRQAGRSDPEYRAYRQRVGLDLYTLFRSPEHAVPISLLPRRIGVDAIIMYQDILTPLEPMGATFHFQPGPVLAEPIRHADQVAALHLLDDPATQMPYIAGTIGGLLRELDGALPLLGFAGAPFTLAAFMIEGSSPMRDMSRVLAFAREQPAAFGALIDALTDMTAVYLRHQAELGVHAAQLFESVGDHIPGDLYERYALPSHQRIMSELPSRFPGMLFVRGSPFPALMAQSGATVLSLAETADLAAVRDAGGATGPVAVQGNVDNRLLATGTADEVRAAVRACIAATGGRGHILNLSHGLLPETPWDNVRAFVEAAQAVALTN